MLNLLAEIEFSLQGRVKKKQVAPLAQSIYDKIINLFREEVIAKVRSLADEEIRKDKIINLFREEVIAKVHSLTDEEIRKMGYTR